MQIPKRFKLMGHTITVEMVPQAPKKEDWRGKVDVPADLIQLVESYGGREQTAEQLGHTFLHELMHLVCYYAYGTETKEKPAVDNEAFIELTSGLLHQALTTMEYE